MSAGRQPEAGAAAAKQAPSSSAAQHHPLDPLTPDELRRAAAVCRQHAHQQASLAAGQTLRFNTLDLLEPPKQQLLAFTRGELQSLPRLAFCVLQTPPEFAVLEAVVDVATSRVVSWVKLDGAQMDGQPLATPDDCLEAEAIARADPRVAALLADRGVSLERVACDPWAIHACPETWQGRRLMQVFLYYKASQHDNEYAHPLDVAPVVDLNSRAVLHIDAYETPPEVPRAPGNYHPALLGRPLRDPLKPLVISQPEGPSFTVDGWHVAWDRWDLRLSFNAREGLVLHQVCYADPQEGGRRRPVLHRAAIAEMAVPYADPRPPYNRKSALDAGDYGLGLAANSLALGCDCSGDGVRYFDGVVNNSKGEAVAIRNAVCLHEEDDGLSWKHVDYRTGHGETRRGRRLVLSFIMTAINYEYAFYWYLHQDGTIGHEVKLTGILSTSLLSPGEGSRPTHGTLIAPGVNAAAHQHLFCARLDMAVDDDDGGRNLVVSELNARQEPTSPANPAGNAFVCDETDLTSSHAAQRVCAPHLNRVWRIKNMAKAHPTTGHPIAYHLHPAQGPCLLAQPDSAVAARALFTTKNLWVVPYQEGRLYPAGQYVLQSRRDSGLALWTQQDCPLIGSATIIFYTFGVTHFPRPEDWPCMPVDRIGFSLRPHGFFAGSPAVDLPPPAAAAAPPGCCQQPQPHQQDHQALAGSVSSNLPAVSKL